MKYIKIILFVILIISISLLGYNCYNYIINNKEYKTIINKIDDIDSSIKDMDDYISINNELYGNDIKNNSEKIELLKKWERTLIEVESSL